MNGIDYVSTGTSNWNKVNVLESVSYDNSTTSLSVADYIGDICAKVDTIGEWVKKKPEALPETKTKLVSKNNAIYVYYYKDGFKQKEKYLMSDFKDVAVINNTIIVTFADGSKTKTTLDPEDEFSLEQGISICITKKLLGDDGSSIYNKLVKKALKVKANNEAAAVQAKQEKENAKRRKQAYEDKRKAKKLRKREEAIEIQKEAFIRAMRELEKNKEKN